MREALEAAVEIARSRSLDRVPVVGIAGAQGAGKTTMVRAFAAAFDGTVAHFSLDDVYLPRGFRRLMAETVHPLFATRGPPGTHNLTLFGETLDELQEATANSVVQLPGFDKVKDNPRPASELAVFKGKPSVILVDGWCLGAHAQTAADIGPPANQLEAEEDPEGVWRREVNDSLGGGYQEAFARLDAILYLRAPDFSVVADWRSQQEAGLLGRALADADHARIARFVAHFERISRHMLAGGGRADVEIDLDVERRVLAVRNGTVAGA